MAMKFYASGCLFDYYAYLLYGRESQCFSVMVNRCQKHDVGHTFTFCDQEQKTLITNREKSAVQCK